MPEGGVPLFYKSSHYLKTLNILLRRGVWAYPKPGPGFPSPSVAVYFVFIELMWDVIIRSGHNGGIIDQHCLTFLFTI